LPTFKTQLQAEALLLQSLLPLLLEVLVVVCLQVPPTTPMLSVRRFVVAFTSRFASLHVIVTNIGHL